MKPYSDNLKHSMAVKLLTLGGPSALSLSGETGISQGTLSRWVRSYKIKGMVPVKNESRSPKNWNAAERFQALLDSDKLKGSELGIFLRKNGLTTVHLAKWKQELINGAGGSKVGRKPKDPEVKSLEKKLKIANRDLIRKDKALAEVSALLILKKKAQAIWGKDEEEE